MKSFEEISSLIRKSELGRPAFIETPFGQRLLCYADLTATGRHLAFVESWIDRVRPLYANTHTAVSSTGRIMTHLREQARDIVARSVNAGRDDVVLFVGAGATAAVNKLVGLLGLRISEPLDREFDLSAAIPRSQRPVVFIGPYEHHSNELPWLESVAELVQIGLDDLGRIDLGDLEAKLAAYSGRKLKIGAFSAASNVTGVLSDVKAIARLLHRGGAYACFDYAAAAPYLTIDMHPGSEEERLDALFLSTHKFIGGPEGSGVLVANRSLFRTRTPERPGGGTVDYVSSTKWKWRRAPPPACREIQKSSCSDPGTCPDWPSFPSTSRDCITIWCRRSSITCLGFKTGPDVRARVPTAIACSGSTARGPSVIACRFRTDFWGSNPAGYVSRFRTTPPGKTWTSS